MLADLKLSSVHTLLADLIVSSVYYIATICHLYCRSIYHLTMLAVPHLVKSKGNVVNVSSVNGMRSVCSTLY